MSEQRTEDVQDGEATTPEQEAPAAPEGTGDGRDAEPTALAAGAAETPGAVTPGAPEGDAPGGDAEAAAVIAAQGEDHAPAASTEGPATAESEEAADGGASGDADSEDGASEGEDSDDDASDGDVAGAGEGSPGRRGGRRAQLEREGEVAADFLENLLDICDLDGDLDVDIDGDRAAVAIVDSDEGRVPRRLVGSEGQVLEALQELTRLAVQSETGERSRLMLDVAGHRAERRANLVTLAKTAIDGVKESGEAASLEPMSAFERKVVHDQVLAAGLHSESDGTEPRRYVVITPA